MAGFSSIIEGCRNIYCDSPFLAKGEKMEKQNRIQMNFLTGKPISGDMQEILDRLSKGEYVGVDEINATKEIQEARSHINHSTPTIELRGRQEFQEHIIDQFLQTVKAARVDEKGEVEYTEDVKREKRLDIVIGLPASGKSSAVVDKISTKYHSRVLDNDIIKAMIPEYNNGWGASVVHKESQEIMKSISVISRCRDENLVMPKVGGDVGTIRKAVITAKRAGYQVYLHYVELSREKATGRMLHRFLSTGRFLAPELIDKYDNPEIGNLVLKTYETIKKDGWIDGYSRWDNDVEVGEKPRLIEGKGLREDFYDRIGKSQRVEKYAGDRKYGRAGDRKDTSKIRTGDKQSLMERIKQNQEKLKEAGSRKPMKLEKETIKQERHEL